MRWLAGQFLALLALALLLLWLPVVLLVLVLVQSVAPEERAGVAATRRRAAAAWRERGCRGRRHKRRGCMSGHGGGVTRTAGMVCGREEVAYVARNATRTTAAGQWQDETSSAVRTDGNQQQLRLFSGLISGPHRTTLRLLFISATETVHIPSGEECCSATATAKT
jgi:hypothetical protein